MLELKFDISDKVYIKQNGVKIQVVISGVQALRNDND